MTTIEKQSLEEKLKSLSPMYAVLYVNKDGTLSGLIENSFSMDLSRERVNIFWSGKGYSMLGEHSVDGKSWAKQNCRTRGYFMVDLTSADCPIEVDFEGWISATSKFYKRNAKFKVKEGFDFSKQAKKAAIYEFLEVRNTAEREYRIKVQEASVILQNETEQVNKEFKKLRRKYESKAKRIAVDRQQCPKLPDGRYMNTGNSRATYDGLQLKWLTPSTVTYVVPWEELF